MDIFLLLSHILIYLHAILHGCPHIILIQELLKVYINILQHYQRQNTLTKIDGLKYYIEKKTIRAWIN